MSIPPSFPCPPIARIFWVIHASRMEMRSTQSDLSLHGIIFCGHIETDEIVEHSQFQLQTSYRSLEKATKRRAKRGVATLPPASSVQRWREIGSEQQMIVSYTPLYHVYPSDAAGR